MRTGNGERRSRNGGGRSALPLAVLGVVVIVALVVLSTPDSLDVFVDMVPRDDVRLPSAPERTLPSSLHGTGETLASEQTDKPTLLDTTFFDDVERTLDVSGRIIDADAAGLAGITVQLLALGVDDQPGAWGRVPVCDQVALLDADLTSLPSTTSANDGTWTLAVPRALARLARDPATNPTALLLFEGLGLTRPVIEWSGSTRVDDVKLIAPLTIRGRAVDEDAKPIADVAVSPFLDGPHRWTGSWSRHAVQGVWSVATDVDGHFEITGLTPHDFNLWFDASDVVGTWHDLEPFVAGIADLGDVLVPRGATVRGRVVSDDGQPIADATVSVSSATPGEWLMRHDDAPRVIARLKHDTIESFATGTTRTDDNGNFVLRGLPFTKSWATATAVGYGSPSAPIAVSRRREAVDIVLPALSATALAIVDTDGRSIEPTTVTVTAENILRMPRDVAHAKPDTLGKVPVFIADDEHIIAHNGALGSVVTVGSPEHERQTVIVSPETKDVVVSLVPDAAVQGRVTQDGAGVVALVTIMNDGRTFETTTDTRGDYHIAGLHTGPCVVAAAADDASARAAREIDIAPASRTVDVDLALQSTGDIAVTLAGGFDLIRSFTVHGRHESGFEHSERLASDRRLRNMLVGEWTFDAPYHMAAGAHVEAGRTTSMEIRPLDLARIVGRVRRDGQPVDSGRVRVLDRGRVVSETAVTKNAAFDIRVDGDARYQLAWTDGSACSFDTAIVEAHWGEAVTHDLDIGGHSVDVTVLDADSGAPLAGIPVSALDERGHSVSTIGHTDADGHLHIPTLSATIHALTVASPFTDDATAVLANRSAITLTTRVFGALECTPQNARGDASFESHRVRFEPTDGGVVIVREMEEHDQWHDGIRPGTWRVVASPTWRDIESLPLGLGQLVAVEAFQVTEVGVPLTY